MALAASARRRRRRRANQRGKVSLTTVSEFEIEHCEFCEGHWAAVKAGGFIIYAPNTRQAWSSSQLGERSAFSFRSLAPIHPYIMSSGVVPISERSSTCRTRKSATSARLIMPNCQSFDAVRIR